MTNFHEAKREMEDGGMKRGKYLERWIALETKTPRRISLICFLGCLLATVDGIMLAFICLSQIGEGKGMGCPSCLTLIHNRRQQD